MLSLLAVAVLCALARVEESRSKERRRSRWQSMQDMLIKAGGVLDVPCGMRISGGKQRTECEAATADSQLNYTRC